MRARGLILGCSLLVAVATSAKAQVDPASGIDFVTVGSPNNPAWAGNGTPNDRAIGRGSVDHSYQIGKYEVIRLPLISRAPCRGSCTRS